MNNLSRSDFSEQDLAELDAFIDFLKSRSRGGFLVLDPKRVEAMQQAYLIIRNGLKELNRNDVKVRCKQNELAFDMGEIDVEGQMIYVTDDWFSEAASYADNAEVYPLAQDKVRLSFAFNRLAVPAK